MSDRNDAWVDDEKPVVGITEDVLGADGMVIFRLVWRIKPHWADVEAYEATSWDGETNAPGFDRKGWNSLPDPVDDIADAVPYLTGFVKWDGCCEFDYPGGSGAEHFCGAEDLIKHFAILKHVYLRAGELSGHNHAESPWPTHKKPEAQP